MKLIRPTFFVFSLKLFLNVTGFLSTIRKRNPTITMGSGASPYEDPHAGIYTENSMMRPERLTFSQNEADCLLFTSTSDSLPRHENRVMI